MICYLCGKELLDYEVVDEDHVPQAGFFLTENPPGIIKLNTHKKCNSSFNKDEHYVITILRGTGNWDPSAERIWNERGFQSITQPNRRGLLMRILDETESIDGNPTTKPDVDRFLNVLGKIVRGLYFNEFSKTLESERFQLKEWFSKQGRWNFDSNGFISIGNLGKEEFRCLRRFIGDDLEYNLFFYNIHYFRFLYSKIS